MNRDELIGGHNQVRFSAPPPEPDEYAARHAPDARELREDLAFALRYGQAAMARVGTWHICCACAGRGVQVGVDCGCRQSMEATSQ